jgi:hypothetical protein
MYWFRAHRYGWGWSPSTWQGWAVTAVWGAAFTAWMAYRSDEFTVGWPFDLVTYAGMLALVAALFVVCWIKGERPRWRWGQ